MQKYQCYHVSKILHGKRGVTDTTAWSVIQDGG